MAEKTKEVVISTGTAVRPVFASENAAVMAATVSTMDASQKQAYQAAAQTAIEGDGRIVRFERLFGVDVGEDQRPTIMRLVKMTELRQELNVSATMTNTSDYLALLIGLIHSIALMNERGQKEGFTVATHVPLKFTLTPRLQTNSLTLELGFRIHRLAEAVYWNGIVRLHLLCMQQYGLCDDKLAKTAANQSVTDADLPFDAWTRLSHTLAVCAEAYTGEVAMRKRLVDWSNASAPTSSMTDFEKAIVYRIRSEGTKTMVLLCGGLHDILGELKLLEDQKSKSAVLAPNQSEFLYTKESATVLIVGTRCIVNAIKILRAARHEPEIERLELKSLEMMCSTVCNLIVSRLYVQESQPLVAYTVIKHNPFLEHEQDATYRSVLIAQGKEANDKSLYQHDSDFTDEETKAHAIYVSEMGADPEDTTPPAPLVYWDHVGRSVRWPLFELHKKKHIRTKAKRLGDEMT